MRSLHDRLHGAHATGSFGALHVTNNPVTRLPNPTRVTLICLLAFFLRWILSLSSKSGRIIDAQWFRGRMLDKRAQNLRRNPFRLAFPCCQVAWHHIHQAAAYDQRKNSGNCGDGDVAAGNLTPRSGNQCTCTAPERTTFRLSQRR